MGKAIDHIFNSLGFKTIPSLFRYVIASLIVTSPLLIIGALLWVGEIEEIKIMKKEQEVLKQKVERKREKEMKKLEKKEEKLFKVRNMQKEMWEKQKRDRAIE